MRLALEPLNRFETSLINTVDQALEVVDAVDSDALGLCLDTFHMNIEERDPAAAADRARRSPTSRRVARTGVRREPIDSSGLGSSTPSARTVTGAPSSIESFTPHNDAIARAAAIWRPLAETPDRLAIDGRRSCARRSGRAV